MTGCEFFRSQFKGAVTTAESSGFSLWPRPDRVFTQTLQPVCFWILFVSRKTKPDRLNSLRKK